MSPVHQARHRPAGRPPGGAAGLTPSLVIAPRFCGPPGSSNGGYACGRIAAYLDGPATVTLRQPPALATPLDVERDAGEVRVRRGGTLIAQAACGPDRPVPAAQARAVAGTARYYADPVFPDCFVCGMSREPGDGLRIFPGPVPGAAVWAAPWTPHPSVTGADGRALPEVVWAALDCPSGIAAGEAAGLGPDTVILLGRMTARLTARPSAGDQCSVIAWPAGRDGRKLTAGSALLGPGGDLLATATAVWLTVPRPASAPAAEGAS